MLFIIDTCVWIDFFDEENDPIKNRFRQIASRFLVKVILGNHQIIMSDAGLKEFKKFIEEENLNFLSSTPILIRILTNGADLVEAQNLSNRRGLPKNDCLLAVQARNHSAIVITRDKHLLYDLADVCEAKKPEEIKFT